MGHRGRFTTRAAAALISALLVGCTAPGGAGPAVGAAGSDSELPKVAFPRSAVHELPSAAGRRYQVWVDLPDSYAATGKPLPVVFVADPSWAFPMVRSIRNLVGRRGRNIEDFVLVGLVTDPALTTGESRARDYTPTDPRRNPAHDPADYDFPAYGEAEAYRDYVESRVFPLIAKHYNVDATRRTYIGHSYGGLFGAYVLLTKPEMFCNYILGSPSLWFDGKAIFRIEEAGAARGTGPRADVFMLTGGYETVRPEPLYETKHDLVEDMRRFERTLAARGYPGLRIVSEVADGEDHLTVYPDVVTRGLLRLLPGTGPFDGG